MNKVEITGVDTSKLKTIPNKKMMELIEVMNQGDKQARETLIYGNLKLVLSVLKKFQNRGENLDDLFQVGCIGLMKAIDNFDTRHNVRFSTYAVPMIIGEIRRYLRDNSSIRVSRSLKDIAYKSLQIKENFINVHHREPTPVEIAKEIGCEPIDIILALEAIQDPISIFTPIYNNGGDTIHLIDQLKDDTDKIDDYTKERMIKESINKLDSRDKNIIFERYFLGKTQTEIAEEIGISQAQVSRLEKNALKQMADELIINK